MFELHDYYRRVGYDGHVGPYPSREAAIEAAQRRLAGSASLEFVAVRSRQTSEIVVKVFRDCVRLAGGIEWTG